MPFKKISEIPGWAQKHCKSPEHNPPSHISLPPGVYDYSCPACGKTVRMNIDGVMLSMRPAPFTAYY